jgi:hypothetical protein
MYYLHGAKMGTEATVFTDTVYRTENGSPVEVGLCLSCGGLNVFNLLGQANESADCGVCWPEYWESFDMDKLRIENGWWKNHGSHGWQDENHLG